MFQPYILVALFIALCWGTLPVAHKSILNHLSPITIMLFSAAIYIFLIIIYASMNINTIYKDIRNITKKDIIIIVLTSAIATFMANVLYYTILKNHESSLISALIYSSPIFTLIIAYIFLKERINTIGIFGILFIVLGIICIAMNNGTSKELEYFTII